MKLLLKDGEYNTDENFPDDDIMPWWRHAMETGSALQVPYEGNPPVTGGNHGIARLDELFVVSLNIL